LHLLVFWGVDAPSPSPIVTPQTPVPLTQRITPADLASAKGHVYPLLLVRLALTWVCAAHTSYRATALIFSTLNGLGIAFGPCAESIRLWLLRIGLFLLRRPLPPCSDWAYLLDLTIQLGRHKCLVILGVSLAEYRGNGYRLDHHDVHILSVQVLTSSTAKAVNQALIQVQRRTGTPVQVVSDHGSDVKGGTRLFCRKNKEVIDIYDISHGLALLLKRYLEPDARWAEFVKACQRTRQQLQQTAGSFLQPPAWRQKARYLNLEGHLTWATDVLRLCATAPAALAEQLGCSVGKSKQWLEEKLGWVREYQEDVLKWSYFQKVVKCAQAEIKHNGLRRSSWQRVRRELRGDAGKAEQQKRFLRDAVKFVRGEGRKVPPRQRYVGSTDVLESLFAKYEELAANGPCREITANVLMIPLFVTTLTADLLREALESVHEQDVRLWVRQQLGPSHQTKKRIVLEASRHTSGDPDVAGTP